MKVKDITWGGNINVEFEISGQIPTGLKIGSSVKIEYDDLTEKYCMMSGTSRSSLTPTSFANKNSLEEYIANNNPEQYIIRVLDIDKTKNIVRVKISYFYLVISLNKLNGIKIKISEKVMDRIPKGLDPSQYIDETFLYVDESGKNNIFIIGINEHDSHKSGKNFTVVSAKKRLNITRINNEFVATKLTDQHGDINAPVSVMSGCVEFVDATQNAAITQAQNECINNALKADTYLKLWEEYNNLEKLMLFKQAKDYGMCEYDGYDVEIKDAVYYRFHLIRNDAEHFTEDVDLDCTDDISLMDDKKSDDDFSYEIERKIKSTYVGAYIKFEGNFLFIVDKHGDSQKALPKRGVLFRSIAGDKKRMRRRDEAKNIIASGEAPLPNLHLLINDGVSNSKYYQDIVPITEEVKRKLKDKQGNDLQFNDKQIEAIKIAVNSPDIALIQGPPGTGKTTVIRAIIARFEEVYKKKNNGEMPKILVTSFQHEAVENAISEINHTGLPVNRVGGKRGGEDQHKISLNKWINDESSRLDEYVSEHEIATVYTELSQLKDEIFSWQSQGKDMAIALDILAKHTKKYKSSFDRSLIDAIDKIRASASITKSTTALDMLAQEDNEYLKKLVNKQRLTSATFSDDGINNIKSLKNDIINGTYENKLPDVLPNFIDEVIKSDGKNEAAFKQYVAFVNELKEDLFEEDNNNTAIVPTNIDDCFNKLIYELDNILSLQVGNQKEASAKILLEYKVAINTGEAERIVNEYSGIRAATCQQSMQLYSSNNIEYDLVVVDEAARANPLDLFIPMAMAKKIVLVGDQRQLPHMLDPDVEKKLESLNLLDKLDVYKKSFFELLFDKLHLQEQGYPYSRTCSLTKQYRMIPEINDFVADNIYRPTNVELECGLDDNTVSKRKIKLEAYENKPLVWVNVSKEKGLENTGKSKFRTVEAEILIDNLKSTIRSTINVKSVGVITFYSKQKEELVRLVNEQFTPAEKNIIEIGTVDAFQGKEYDIVFLSCVRSNSYPADEIRKSVGFLCDENRLCVALSRARNLLVAVGDSETVCTVKILNNFIQTCRDKDGRGCYLNV